MGKTNLQPKQSPIQESQGLVSSGVDAAKADALRFQQREANRNQDFSLNDAREAVRKAKESAQAQADRAAGERAARATVAAGREAAKRKGEAAKAELKGSAIRGLKEVGLALADRVGLENEAIAASSALGAVTDSPGRIGEALSNRIRGNDEGTLRNSIAIEVARSQGLVSAIADIVSTRKTGKTLAEVQQQSTEQIATEQSGRDEERRQKRKRKKSTIRPCPTPGRICSDGSRCGGRAASVRGKTTGYDS